MEQKIKVGLTSTVLALGCAGVTYAILKYNNNIKQIQETFNNLTIHIVTTENTCDEVVSELRRRCSLHHAIGFDCEWVTEKGKRSPVALIQLSSFDGVCGLFRMSHLKKMPDSLKELLEDKTIYKVGVAPLDDARYLHLDYSVALNSVMDVRHIVKHCGYDNPGGLATLTRNFLGITLDKSWRVRCSDWGASELTSRQIKYAATDAHVAVKIFVKLLNEYDRGSILDRLFGRQRNIWNDLNKICWPYADISYKSNQPTKSNNDKRKEKNVKPTKEKISKMNATRLKPLYNNCVLEAPDGEMLCTCDSKKAMWYVDKQLGDVMKEEPLTVRLRFEPSGRSVGDVGRYYQQMKQNRCVVCGNDSSYIRKNVVPREYRKYLPDIMKDHSSHDVVLLCFSCHQRSNKLDQPLREKLAAACQAPLPSHSYAKYTEDLDCKKVHSAARALLHSSNKLPEARRKVLEDVIRRKYPHQQQFTEEFLKEVADLQFIVENPEYEAHGLRVVEWYLAHEGLLRLEELWRENFLETMHPQYMPELWSIKHNEQRLRVKFDEGRLSMDELKVIGFTKWTLSS